MKRARDIRDQLEGLLERVEIEPTSSLNDLDAVKKAITSGVRMFQLLIFLACCSILLAILPFFLFLSGFFHHSAKLQNTGAYKTLKNPQTVYIHPSSGLAEVNHMHNEYCICDLLLLGK